MPTPVPAIWEEILGHGAARWRENLTAPGTTAAGQIDIRRPAFHIAPVEDEQTSKPLQSEAVRAAQAKRDLRRGAALRANLRRRKAQERGREGAPSDTADTPLAHKLFQDISE
jgi:hypothetical protein